jgi:membrane-bound lytic murein transglycosylase B
LFLVLSVAALPAYDESDAGFDISRWYETLHKIQNAALEQKISAHTINMVIQQSAFVPGIIPRDKKQAEFTLTIDEYVARSVGEPRIGNGKKASKKYKKMLASAERKYGVPKSVILALWGMESDYGASKGGYKISDSLLTLIYDGRREEFFTTQLLALMKLADKNRLNIEDIYGSWAGAMGHFQFIPTTLRQYGIDGNGDGRVDIINSVADAMASAGNYLKKMGWNKNERIVRRVILPENFDRKLCDGNTKKPLTAWRKSGVWGVPQANKTSGILCERQPSATDGNSSAAYLTYDNFYRIKKWNNSNNYALSIALLADKLK